MKKVRAETLTPKNEEMRQKPHRSCVRDVPEVVVELQRDRTSLRRREEEGKERERGKEDNFFGFRFFSFFLLGVPVRERKESSATRTLPLSLSPLLILTSGATFRQSASFLRSLASPEVTEMYGVITARPTAGPNAASAQPRKRPNSSSQRRQVACSVPGRL